MKSSSPPFDSTKPSIRQTGSKDPVDAKKDHSKDSLLMNQMLPKEPMRPM